jgi:hypothetical protein
MPRMEALHPLQEAIDIIGLAVLSRELKVSHQAIRKWQERGRLPRTEWTGETDYSGSIARLSGDRVKRERLLAPWPKWTPQPRSPRTIEHVSGMHVLPAVIPPTDRAAASLHARDAVQREVDTLFRPAARHQPRRDGPSNHRERKG